MEPVIDHLCWLVEDGEEFSNSLRRDHGFGSEQGMYYSRAGTQHWNVPLAPPAYLEFMAIVNRHDAEHGDVGPESLAAEARGHGPFSWSVLVDDLKLSRSVSESGSTTTRWSSPTALCAAGGRSVDPATCRFSSTTRTILAGPPACVRCTSG